MLGQNVEIHAFADCCLDNFFECVLGMTTELARVRMVRERHIEFHFTIAEKNVDLITLTLAHRASQELTRC